MATVKVDFTGGSVGVGAPITEDEGTATLDDGKSNLDPQGLEGSAEFSSIGVNIFGADFGKTILRVGDANLSTNVNITNGIGANITFGLTGKSEIKSIKREKCSCPKQ